MLTCKNMTTKSSTFQEKITSLPMPYPDHLALTKERTTIRM